MSKLYNYDAQGLITISPEEMLALWRSRRLLVTDMPGGSMSAEYPPAVDAQLKAEIDAWYRRYLLTAGAEVCPVVSVADEVSAGLNGESCDIYLPRGILRVVRVRMSGWRRDARIVPTPTLREKAMQENAFTRAGRSNPVALHEGRSLRLFPAAGTLTALDVVRLDLTTYTFVPGALESLRPIADISTIS